MTQRLKFYKYFIIIVLQFFVIRNVYGFRETEGDSLSNRYPLSVGFSYQYGFTMNHNPAVAALHTKHFSTYELSLQRQTTGAAYWEQKCAYPAYGVTFMYSELANPKYLGRMFGLYPYLDVPLVSWKNNNKICFNIGLGIACGTKPYHRFDNYKNLAYGSHFNALVHFGLKGNVRIFPKCDLSGGVNFTHISNGTTKEPNFGLNTSNVFLGVNYQINDASGQKIVNQEETRPKYPYTFQIALYGGGKDTDWLTGTPLYFVGDLNFNLLKQYRFARSWGAGLGVSMDYAAVKMLKNEGKFTGSALSYMIPSVRVIHQFHVSRICIGTELGYMIYHKADKDSNMFLNLTVGYDVNDKLTAGMLLHAGAFFADYIGFGLGFKVWNIK